MHSLDLGSAAPFLAHLCLPGTILLPGNQGCIHPRPFLGKTVLSQVPGGTTLLARRSGLTPSPFREERTCLHMCCQCSLSDHWAAVVEHRPHSTGPP